MLRFLLGLSDRQAAESVRCRIDFKYAMAMELDDLGFHHSVLADFRDRLSEDDRADRLLDLARAPPPPTAPAPWDFLHESSVTCNSVSAAEQQTPEWKARYAVRSGVEGTVNESAHGHGMRRCRYRGQGKAHIQHVLTAIAVNIERLSGLPPAEEAPIRRRPTAFPSYLDQRELPRLKSWRTLGS
ncbi:transposase [Streptomyces stelliscabiei]|uniref:IS5 family transposase n=2 Tax=Streptomyces stelliscabiei TaxID=146820 RepID=A0A8I0TV39_9ACTN|nr:transposase [Streptomyces stelliscabiei]MBE1602900.1 IS5 family transposase [Streptomyces stelliscabiei]MDX2522573.1 transposase [Streptomyces stelliscabiei]